MARPHVTEGCAPPSACLLPDDPASFAPPLLPLLPLLPIPLEPLEPLLPLPLEPLLPLLLPPWRSDQPDTTLHAESHAETAATVAKVRARAVGRISLNLRLPRGRGEA